MDVTQLTEAEVQELMGQLSLRLEQLRVEARDSQTERAERITAAIGTLDALLGAEDAEPGTDSIRAVRGYTGEVMAEHAAIALPLAFQGLEILTTVVRDLAATIAHDQ